MDQLTNNPYPINYNQSIALRPEAWQTWGIGMIIVTISAFASPACIIFVPLLNKNLYERVMTFLVALGIGALSASVIFIMLPHAFQVPENEGTIKSLIIIGSLYTFFAIDRILKYAIEIKHRRKLRKIAKINESNKNDLAMESRSHKSSHTDDEIEQIQFSTRKQIPVIMHLDDSECHTGNNNSLQIPQSFKTIYSTSPTLSQRSISNHHINDGNKSNGHKISVSVAVVEQMEVRQEALEISSIAYMILFGSSANNFVDGMSNGVAFADSLGRGLSIGIACIAQQFPQELGTLAILVQSGLGLKKTLLLNLIPGILSYLGFIIGVLLDDYSEGADTFVFAISSGMYLYVFLGTLIPEMREATTELINNNFYESIIVTVLQSAGLLVGLSFMYLMTVYANKIEF
ncbi:Metal cation symporter ZIP14 [Dirofilaria immitis]